MRKLKVVENGFNYSNVVFLGPAPHNTRIYKRVRLGMLTDTDKKNIVAYEACRFRNMNGRRTGCKSCKGVCVMAIVKMNEEEKHDRLLQLKEIFPLTKF